MRLRTVSGQKIHPIGIGTWRVGGTVNLDNITGKYQGAEPVYGNEVQEVEAIRYSISQGQNHIDCAEMYGGFYTDVVVGKAIAGLPREDLFIVDKLWKTSVAKGMVRPTVESMLRKLGTDYLDVLSIHAPWFDVPWQEAIPQIDQLIDEGVVRHFGLSNFSVQRMEEVLSLAKHPVAMNQMHFNVLHQVEANQAFRDFCARHDIQIVAYQPLKRGEVLQDETVQAIAQAHDATPAQVGLAWLIQIGALPIPKALSKEHIDENLDALNVILSATEMHKLTLI